jgi:hypothetical protein
MSAAQSMPEGEKQNAGQKKAESRPDDEQSKHRSSAKE